ncbi:BLUF domain-containing protein [Lacimicrobium alkaliphilum]|uniref:BLUF domain-containing protein n=1 Tax=Lacimicrobium alkaliphilum TaxID=1526571 RepID=A0A0U2Z696_9ALTE|nr:BLUF domain-containing protein [Lacimicrobium alkaliphilum]ALS97988.1 hypothetical protein AT746_06730 [Lacimicrobium alkaliphilum]
MTQQRLYQLIYISDATGPVTQTILDDIAIQAKIYNAGVQITGRLLATDKHFIQVLEGGKGEVEALMGKISEDKRHHNLRILSRGPVVGREFSQWSMGVKGYLDEQEQQDMIQILNMYGANHSYSEEQVEALYFLIQKA